MIMKALITFCTFLLLIFSIEMSAQSKYAINEDFKSACRITPPLGRGALRIGNAFLTAMPKGMRSDKQLSIRKVKITSSVDGESVRAWVIVPKVNKEKLPAILFLHGGGFVFKAAPYHYDLAKSYALCANAVVNRKMWSYYLQENHETSLLDFSPPQSFPATYLETAEFDCLRDEGDLFAEMLRASAVQVQCTTTQGTMHGFDMVQKSKITIEQVENRCQWLKTW